MGLKCAIVGLPNVGKSTLFNALTHLSIETENFLFCTIEPNTGIVNIPDLRMDQLANIVKPQRIFPTTMQFVDIAGLIKGASRGEGLGNQFLTHIRETEAIAHVVRCFENDHILHIAGKVDPARDIDIINTELALSDLEICERVIHHRMQKRAKISSRSRDNEVDLELSVLKKCRSHLNHIGILRTLGLNQEEERAIHYINFLTLKPTIYIANVHENSVQNNPYLDIVRALASSEGSIVVPVCAALESDIAKLKEEERDQFIAELGLREPGINRIIRAGYNLLQLRTYFTVGVKEVRAWTIPSGTTASQAAGKIHTDLEKGFIRAQIISFEDFITYQGEKGAKEAGKMHSEGKQYLVKDGDVINFLFNI